LSQKRLGFRQLRREIHGSLRVSALPDRLLRRAISAEQHNRKRCHQR
jgi:hypothetical protein